MTAHLVAVHARHVDVEQDEVRLLARDDVQSFLSVLRRHDLVAARDERRLEQRDVRRDVVHDEDLGQRFAHVGRDGAQKDFTCAGNARLSIGFER